MVVVATLVVVLSLTIHRVWNIDRTAGVLLLPYLAWVTFATILNAAIVALH